MFDKRSEITRFQVSPRSLLRNIPSREASQIVPVESTATELIRKSVGMGLGLNHDSPPLTETAMALRLAATAILPDKARLLTYFKVGRVLGLHVPPESVLINMP